VVPKKGGGIRWIQDLQSQKGVTIRNSGVLPDINLLTERYAGQIIYSAFDLHSWYDQLVLHHKDCDMTAFRTPNDVNVKELDVKDEKEVKKGVRKFVMDHIRDVGEIRVHLEKAGARINVAKALVGLRKVKMLGFRVGQEGQWPIPTNPTKQRGFIGECVFFRLWIPWFSVRAAPLFHLLRKNVEFEW
jgi:hypothetical protein